jgi:hypothetical protein
MLQAGVDNVEIADSSYQEVELNCLLSHEPVAIGGTTKSLKFLASIQGNEVLVLVDSGSSHSFINVKMLPLLSGVSNCCQPKPTNGCRQATRESGGPEPLSVGPVAHTRPEVEVRWACHLTYTWLGRYLMCFS